MVYSMTKSSYRANILILQKSNYLRKLYQIMSLLLSRKENVPFQKTSLECRVLKFNPSEISVLRIAQ